MRSVLQNLIVRALALFPAAIATLLSTRLLIGEYDVEVFNAFTLIFSLMVLIPLNDLGAGAALTTSVAEHGATHPDTQRVALTAARMLALSTAFLVTVSLLLSAFDWWGNVLGEGTFTTGAFGLALAAYGLSFVPGLGQSALLGINKNELTILVQASLAPAMAAGVGLCVALEAPAWTVVVVPGLAVLVISLVNAWIAAHETRLHLLPLLPKLFRRARYPGARIAGIAGPALIVLLTTPITLQSQRIVLSHFGTSDDVAKFSVAVQVFMPLFVLIPAAARPLWPMFANARATGTKPVSLSKVILLFMTATALASAVLVVLSDPISKIVSDDQIELGIVLPLLVAGGAMVQAIAVPMSMAMMYPAGLRVVARLCLLSTPVGLVLSIMLAGPMGASGTLLAGLIVAVGIQTIPAIAWIARNGLGTGGDASQARPDGLHPAPSAGSPEAAELEAEREAEAVSMAVAVEALAPTPGGDLTTRWRENEHGRTW